MKPAIEKELALFDSDEQRQAFQDSRVPPAVRSESWQYSDETHACLVVATDATNEIVYCPTGFGPAFPWGVQRAGETDLGMDSDWFAYLYEAFVQSTLWPHGPPVGFVCTGPGERGV